jgi:hypothetical protein
MATPKAEPGLHRARGDQTQFFDDPVDEALLAMVMALLGEVSVLRDRLDAHERLLAQGLPVDPAGVDAYVPDEATEAERRKVRQRLLRHVMRPIRERLLPEELTALNRDYRAIFDDVQGGG